MKLRLICYILMLACVSGCVASKKRKIKAPVEMVSLSDARDRIVVYHGSGKYKGRCFTQGGIVADLAVKAIREQVKYPAVVMVVEDVMLSTYEARRKQGFSDNLAAHTDLESHVILSSLPAVKPSVVLFEFLLQRNIPVFLVSYRAEGFRVPLMENFIQGRIFRLAEIIYVAA